MAFEGHMGGVDLPRRSFVRSLLEIRDILGGRLCFGWMDGKIPFMSLLDVAFIYPPHILFEDQISLLLSKILYLSIFIFIFIFVISILILMHNV